MKTNIRTFFFSILFTILFIAIIFLIVSQQPSSSYMAYPGAYPEPSAPLSYPGPQVTATATFAWQTGQPWPTPTPHTFPTPGVPRQGVATTLGGVPPAAQIDRQFMGSWEYTWGPYISSRPPVEGVPMLATNISNGLISVAQIQDVDARTPHNYWLLFNECENNHLPQCGGYANVTTYTVAAFYYYEVVRTVFDSSVPGGQLGADPDAQIIIGGGNASFCGIKFLMGFVESYRRITEKELGAAYDPPRAGWHFHIYPEVVPINWPSSSLPNYGCDTSWEVRSSRLNINDWRDDAMNMLEFAWLYGTPDDEIWVTETGCLAGSGHCQGNTVFMQEYVPAILGWLNNQGRWINRYAWWTDWSSSRPWTRLYDATSGSPPPNGSVTRSDLGEYYTQIEPASAVPKPWPTAFIYLPLVMKNP